jgi:ParB family chromosome partitioning protein
LGEIADAASEAALGRALTDDEEEVRWAAREALTKIFPNERTRIEFLAVESEHGDMSGPAAAFLADEGDAALLLTKLGALKDRDLRERIRFGLARRAAVPTVDIAKLLAASGASARADAAWLAGARASQTSPADATVLGKALVEAANKAQTGYAAAKKAGDDTAENAESAAWVRAAWAARLLAPDAFHAAAKKLAPSHDVPIDVRIQAALSLPGEASLKALMSESDLSLRFAAATSLAGDALALRTSPLDPVALARAVTALPKQALSTDPGRRIHLPHVLGSRNVTELAAVACDGKGQDRLDAIAALGLAPGDETDKALRALAFSKSEPEDVRRIAYKSLRRAMRVTAREKRREATS